MRSFHSTVLLGNLHKAVCRAIYIERGVCLLQWGVCTNTGRQVTDFLQEKHPDMCVPPLETPTCAAFEEY